MASITLCPRCSSHLELPTGIAPTSLVECPICEAEFLLASVAPRTIPKVRVVKHDVEREVEPLAEERTPAIDSPSTFSAVVDEDVEPTQPATAAEDNLSRLLRASAGWQIPGVQPPRDEEGLDVAEDLEGDDAASLEPALPDDRVIPNDHAPAASKLGATLDAAYRDADPEIAAEGPTAVDDLQLAGSRLDQLLSDLMKPQTVAPTPPAEPVAAREETPSLSTFAEFEAGLATEAQAAASVESPSAAHDDEEKDNGHSFDDRRRPRRAADQRDAAAEQAGDRPEEDEADAADVDDDSSPEDEFASLDLRTAPRRKRRPAGMRTLVGVVGGGAIGILGGAYALLWLRGPDVDVLHMANWLPPAMLPASMQSAPASSLADQGLPTPPSEVDEPAGENGLDASPPSTLAFAETAAEPVAEPGGDELAGVAADSAAAPATAPAPVIRDQAVAPAGATEPIADAAIADAAVAPAPGESPMHWPTTPIVGALRGMPRYTLVDLDALLVGADAAHRRFLAGDLARKEDVAAMGQAYIELCKLAEEFTLTDPAEYGNELITKQMNAKNIFRGVAGDPARRNDLAMIAGRWLQHNRRPNQGVVVLGKVTDLRALGEWTEYTIETPLGDATATSKVLLDGVPFASGSDVAVVGTIVADPRNAIIGYEGDAPQVIVAGFAFVPEDFVAPMIGGTSGEPADLFSLGE